MCGDKTSVIYSISTFSSNNTFSIKFKKNYFS